MNDGERIKELLQERGLSQKDLAVGLKTNEVKISRWIRQAYLYTNQIKQVCDFLEISMSDFFFDNKSNANKFEITVHQKELMKKINSLPVEKREHLMNAFFEIVESCFKV